MPKVKGRKKAVSRLRSRSFSFFGKRVVLTLPFKPEHITQEEIERGLARLAQMDREKKSSLQGVVTPLLQN